MSVAFNGSMLTRVWWAPLLLVWVVISPQANAFDDCGKLDRYGYVKGVLSGFAAQGKEKSFAEMYSRKLTLPISETAFLEYLKSKHLSFDVIARGENAVCAASPQMRKVKDLSITKVYLITDMATLGSNRGVHFAAYVDKDGNVTYIENRFEYVGP